MPHGRENAAGSIAPEKDIFHLKRENNALRENAMTFSCLGKLRPTNGRDISRWMFSMKGLIKEATNGFGRGFRPLIIGLAESGIVPSALFHHILREEGIDADWICSTRRPSGGIQFKESHSHAPDHHLPLPGREPTELWFVEDEITTGRTILNLALNLTRILSLYKVRFFAISDVRSQSLKERFSAILSDKNLDYTVHTLFNGQNASGDEHRNNSDWLEKEFCPGKIESLVEATDSNWHLPHMRPALKNQLDVSIRHDNSLKGTLLVVGEAIDIGLRLALENRCLSFHHVTLSPWQVDNRNIRNRLDINGKYYLYNYNDSSDIHLLCDPIDREIGEKAASLLRDNGHRVRELSFNQ